MWPQFGAFSWEYRRGELGLMVKAFHGYGLQYVQLAGELLDEAFEQPEATQAQLNDAGITIAGLGAYRNLVNRDLAKRRANLDFLKHCLAAAPLLGTNVVATETGTFHPSSDWLPTPENRSVAAWNALDAALDELLPVAEQHGSLLAIEGFVGNVLMDYEQLAHLLNRHSSRHLALVCDPYNYLTRELVPDAERLTTLFLERFAERFVLAHLKDVSAEGAENETPEFGTGVFPQAPYLAFLRITRPELPLILEHLPDAHIPAVIARVKQSPSG